MLSIHRDAEPGYTFVKTKMFSQIVLLCLCGQKETSSHDLHIWLFLISNLGVNRASEVFHDICSTFPTAVLGIKQIQCDVYGTVHSPTVQNPHDEYSFQVNFKLLQVSIVLSLWWLHHFMRNIAWAMLSLPTVDRSSSQSDGPAQNQSLCKGGRYPSRQYTRSQGASFQQPE